MLDWISNLPEEANFSLAISESSSLSATTDQKIISYFPSDFESVFAEESLSINMENKSARVENSISLIFLW